MEKQGLVRKVNDLDKKNMVRVYLTDEGQQVYRKAAKRESIREIMSCLSDEECRQLISSLRKLRNKALKKLGIEDRVHLLGY
jgi:DNA-binding MarR family transcriptional regulator